ncbi:3-oxoacyl-ACP synthase III [Tundrisphaera sp. TA3]|uniref:3-oxoacyl-ACP synthase III n=1 Tax=Tundrisphaera sp. TA3 TaxID=3435775 RepID=UPI003EB8BA48
MKYSNVFIDAIGYELAPVVVGSDELEARLRPLYDALRIPPGQIESLTGIVERRWWDPGYPVSAGAAAAARHALEMADVRADQVEVLIYGGVCRELFEPATACRVAAEVGVGPDTTIHDVSNACLGALTGMVDIANRIELGQIRAGMVVTCETSREINDIAIDRMLAEPTMETFRDSLATMTGGSGAVAIVLTDGSFANKDRRRLLGGVTKTAPQFHALCRWGMERIGTSASFGQFMATDSISVLKHGVELGTKTWKALLSRMGWAADQVDRVICHQVGSGHRDTVLGALGIDRDRDFSTYPHLGNIGTVSVPLTAAVAEERDFLRPGDRVGWLGIGSGLNCLMLGLEW